MPALVCLQFFRRHFPERGADGPVQLSPSGPGRQGERGKALRERRAGSRRGRLSEATPVRSICERVFSPSFFHEKYIVWTAKDSLVASWASLSLTVFTSSAEGAITYLFVSWPLPYSAAL